MPNPQIAVLDTGGQYTHLIARKVRELGVYADVLPSETPAAVLQGRKGLIISGGPASVYEEGSPTVDPDIFAIGSAVLGICYGQQLMARFLGGEVWKGDKGEYGLATLSLIEEPGSLFANAGGQQQIWMSHRDTVRRAPQGFAVTGSTGTCAIAAIAAPDRRLFGVQFHPEVVHTHQGSQILSNFVFNIAGCTSDWDPRHRVPLVEQKIREIVGDRNVFFFVSGGVDSTVAFTLCLRALGQDRVSGYYVDTGLMREGETAFVRRLFETLGAPAFSIEEAGEQFLGALTGVTDPEIKRKIIGSQFVEVQDRILRTGHFVEGNWILGQGTIYPDTIESGGTAKADLIKTHHNRVAGIQTLMEQGRIVEPLSYFYKDEVREIGRELGIVEDFLERHPFPGPGLAIRCLCTDEPGEPIQIEAGYILPVKSVGVQGDLRTYRPVLAIEGDNLHERAVDLINSIAEVNRVIAELATKAPISSMRSMPATLTEDRLNRLRQADVVVRRVSAIAGFDRLAWQFPVITIPFGTPDHPDSVVLRPVNSVDGMTAQALELPADVSGPIVTGLMEIPGVCAVFLDLTHKPPGTIEWE
ncbi:MAG: glutamine-hydrolyzing GMP synthase [Bryobacteraceae bacterium]|nr:glutamine-hydrolyzing GMP synthase [Bryobacteraceae bacterium]